METLEVKLVHINQDQRFYKLNHKLKIFPNKSFNYDKEFEYQNAKIRDEYKGIIDNIKNGTDIICISDAHTHIERLAFPGIEFNIGNGTEYGRFSLHCDGKHTFMIYGGNTNAVYPDEVYLRRIASVNNMKLLIIK